MSVTKPYFRRRRWGFALAAMLLGLSPLIVIECLLRLTGLGVPTSYQDPFVSFSGIYPLFELNAEGSEYRTARHHHYFFGPQEFSARKGDAAFRVFCLGGSTVLGHPYQTETAFARWLEIELAGRDPSREYEVINCGGMSYASYRLIPILEEVLNHEPDLIVVMTGHNEFLEDRTYQAMKQRTATRAWMEDRLFSLRMVTLGSRAIDSLRADRATADGKTSFAHRVDTRLDHASGYASYHRDEPWWAGVTAHYTLNIRVMVRLCRQAGVPLVLVNPGSNIRDCPPFKSENSSNLAPRRLAEWRALFERGGELEVASAAGALAAYERAAAIDALHAQLVFRMARCLDRLGRYEEARAAYVRAKELDVCPLRMIEVMQQNLSEVAKTTSTPLVDAAGLLTARSRHGMAGYDWYVDQVHPSIRGHQLIAQAIALRLYDLGIVPSGKQQWGQHDRRQAYRTHIDALGDRYLAAGRRRVEWLETWARRDRLREVTLPQDARAMLDLANSYMEFAEYEKARDSYRLAWQHDQASAHLIMARAFQLFQGGRSAAADRIVRSLLQWDLNDRSLVDQAHIALAVLACDNGRLEDAMEYAKAVQRGLSRFEGTANMWLDELPEAKTLFD